MNREVTFILTLMLMHHAGTAFAQAVPDDPGEATKPLMVIDHRTTLIPERWCVKSQSPAPLQQLLPVTGRNVARSASTVEYVSYNFQSADHSALAARLSELDSERLLTFWRGRSLGLYFGITEGGVVGLSFGQKKESE